jgi:hypothetical protein
MMISNITIMLFRFIKPRRCQQIIQQVIGRWLGDELDQTTLSLVEKEVLRLKAAPKYRNPFGYLNPLKRFREFK